MPEINDYSVSFRSPAFEDFCQLRKRLGWGETEEAMAQKSLDKSLFHVCIHHQRDHNLLAMGRVIGDGSMYFYIQDLIVDPDFQGQGLGKTIMDHIENYLTKTVKEGASIGLFAAQGKEGFYSRYGYIERSGALLGKGMSKFI